MISGAVLVLLLGEAHAHGLVDEQIAEVTRRVSQSPGDCALYLRRAELNRAHGDADAARADLQAALSIDPGHAPSLLALARLERETNNLDVARSAVGAYLRHHPGEPVALEEKARILSAAGDWVEAAAAWDACLHASPNAGPDISLSCAEVHRRAGSTRRALTVVEDAIRSHPRVIPLRQEAASLCIQLEDHTAARRQFEALRVAYPTLKARLLADEGRIWRSHERFSDARAAYLEARVAFGSLAPSRRSQPAFRILGERIGEALDALEKQLNPPSQ